MGLFSLLPILGILVAALRHGGAAALDAHHAVMAAGAGTSVDPAQALAAACILVLSLRLTRRVRPNA